MYGVLIAALTAAFQWLLPRLISVVGTAVVSTAVYDPLLSWMQSRISQSFSGLSAEAYGFLQFTGITTAITIIFAAITMKLGIKAGKAAFAKKGATGA